MIVKDLNWFSSIVCIGILLLASCGSEQGGQQETTSHAKGITKSTVASNSKGSKEQPLRVMLVPADGGTEQGTLADYEPIFHAITQAYDIHFNIKVGQSYNSVVEGLVAGKLDIAFFGAVTYHQAKQQGVAELLAVAVKDGQSIYYSGIFTRKDSGINKLEDLKGKSLALGDVNSTSSFNYPVATLLEHHIDPIDDLGKIYLAGSHANSLAALESKKVDAACASYTSFEKAVNNADMNPEEFQPIYKSDPIPYPPLAMHIDLEPELKKTLREAFHNIHKQPGVTPDMIRGYGGKKVDRFISDYPESEFDKAMSKLAKVTDELKAQMIKHAANK